MPTYLLLDPSSINALIIITLLFEILTLLRVVRSLDSILYEPMLQSCLLRRRSPSETSLLCGMNFRMIREQQEPRLL